MTSPSRDPLDDLPPADRLDPVDGEVREELRFHLEGRVEELVARGWGREEAWQEARRRFGDVRRIHGDCRRIRGHAQRGPGGAGMEGWRQDLKLALRELAADRGLAALVVLTLALGMGFATAIFGVVDGVLLRPLPYDDPSRLVYLWQNDRATGTVRERAGTADFYDFRDRTRSFAGVSMFGRWTASMTRGDAEPVHLNLVSAHHDLAAVLGVEPVLGRFVTAGETEGDGAGVAVLSWELWEEAFGGEGSVVGRTMTLDGRPTEIVGVLPRGAGLVTGGEVDAFTPLQITRAGASRNPHWVTVVARLAPGVGLATARSEMNALASRLEAEVPENLNRGAFVEPVDDWIRGDVRRTLLALAGAVAVLLLLTVLNVTNLLLARATARTRASAVHRALGAGALRTARRNLGVALLLTGTAGVLGSGVAWLASRGLLALAPVELVRLGAPRLHLPVLAFVLGLVTVLGLVFGVVPSLRAQRLELQPALSGARGGGAAGPAATLARRLLVAGQAGLAAVLLVGATLVGSTLLNLQRVDPGFETDRLLRTTMTLPRDRYPADFSVYPDWPERHEFQREVLRRVGAVPGVEVAAFTLNHPLDPGFTNSFAIEGRPPDPDRGEMTTRMVTPGYFEAVGLALREGRLPRPHEGVDDPGVVVLNEAAARRHFPDGDALGARISFWGAGWREVVGIVADEKVHGLREAPPPAFYTSLHQTPAATGALTLMVRTRGEPLEVAPAVREAVAAVDPQLALYDVTTMEATRARAVQRETFAARVLQVFAAVALVLAALGVYGVLAYTVARRTRELGIRQALGADGGRIRTMVLRQGLGLVAAGLAVGLVGARLGAGILDDLLYGLDAGTAWPYLGAAAILLAVAAAASLIPARRAAAVSPAEALRGD